MKRLLPDVLAAGGVVAGLYGLHLIYPPLTWVLGGGLLIFIAVRVSGRIERKGGTG